MKALMHTAALAGVLALVSQPVLSQEDISDEMFDLKDLTCWDVISLSPDDSAFFMAMLIGYVHGSSGESSTSARAIVTQVEAFDKTCGDNPEMPALQAMGG